MNAPTFRLIRAVDRDGIIGAFEALATNIQRRGRCDHVTAPQRAIDENPEAFEDYQRAMR